MVMKREETELMSQLESGRGGAWEYPCLVRKLRARLFKHGHVILNDPEKRSARGSNVVGLTAVKSVFSVAPMSLLSILLFALFFKAVASGPILTIESPDGDTIDCVNIEHQPTLRHPLFKNHKIEEPPTDTPSTGKKEAEMENVWQVWHTTGTKCPEGSIPLRRPFPPPNDTSSSSRPGIEVTEGHEHAIGRMINRPKIYGTQATMNVWHPTIETKEEFSLGQIWLLSGSYDNNDINSIEAGWQIYPGLYLDYQPRFFIYWTTDAYNNSGCYNTQCPGFVQTSNKIAVEGAISRTSIFGGPPVDLTIKIWKDQKLGSWWLGVIIDNGTFEPVGYWPSFLFPLLKEYAERVEWGGEIVNTHASGRHTSTQMGSGCYPGSGIGKVAYMRDLQVALSEKEFQPVQDLEIIATSPHYYGAEILNDTFFYYGGPDYLKSIAAHPILDHILIYFGFALFLLV